jgi:hypothetical protein
MIVGMDPHCVIAACATSVAVSGLVSPAGSAGGEAFEA